MNLATRLPFSPSARLPPVLRTSAHKFKIISSHVRIPTEAAYPAPAACGRRELVILTALAAAPARAEEEEVEVEKEKVKSVDTTITDRIFMDIAVCPNAFRLERGSAVAEDEERTAPVCPEVEALGRIVIGLYGKQVPRTVANFRAMCTGKAGSTYEGSLIHKVFPGQYLVAGKQGRKEKGEVPPPHNLERNLETVEPGAFRLRHTKPGTVSLCLSENDDEDQYRLSPDYRNVEFLITTGPGPCPQLDNKNIVFGTVLEGMDVVTAIAAIPTYRPAERIRQLNDLAEFIGDERAQNARNLWNRPLKSLLISSCGELQVAKPSLAPSLP